ncbi:unnamed protein product [Adineta steineri]|uniref:Uncharacterized protein n=1 Tax=Adineta steineri TaxID=433720 RepID=A0A819UUY0_9BILA|nr:unnamed protein product [Adineta steineri]CAF4086703.1 unnamed protein product [Adineta steineri]
MSRSALVTGAAQGMGRAIALRLARDGLNVAINDINSNTMQLNEIQKTIEKMGQKSIVITADVSNEKAVSTMMKNVVKELGSLDVAIANAGICPIKPLIEITADEWDTVLATNLRGVFLCYKEAAKVMIAQGKGGKIIGACSMVAYRSTTLASHYIASKWGVRGLTQAAALELAQHKITVNAYCPGYVETKLIDSVTQEFTKYHGTTQDEVKKNFIQMIPLGRPAQPDDIANFVSYLASRDSDYMTGQSVIVDGGFVLT